MVENCLSTFEWAFHCTPSSSSSSFPFANSLHPSSLVLPHSPLPYFSICLVLARPLTHKSNTGHLNTICLLPMEQRGWDDGRRGSGGGGEADQCTPTDCQSAHSFSHPSTHRLLFLLSSSSSVLFFSPPSPPSLFAPEPVAQ